MTKIDRIDKTKGYTLDNVTAVKEKKKNQKAKKEFKKKLEKKIEDELGKEILKKITILT